MYFWYIREALPQNIDRVWDGDEAIRLQRYDMERLLCSLEADVMLNNYNKNNKSSIYYIVTLDNSLSIGS